VIAEAEAQVPEAERTLDALLAAVEARERDQMLREADLAARLTDVEAQRAALEAQDEAQTIREGALKRRERDAEKSAREQARNYLLEARDTVEAAIAKAETAGGDAAREARRLVEQAAATEAEALKAIDAGRRTTVGTEALEPGRRVRLDSGTAGEVLEIRGDGKAVVRVGSLKLVVEPGALTLLADQERSTRVAARHAAVPDLADSVASYELDLRGMTGDEAEQTVIAALDQAVLAEQPYLRIIHGKGTGVVRERVQQVLGRDRRVKSHAFAPSNQGGSGVTVAEFAE
jgi:DNA mismatch repair protein MutS2